MNIPIKKLPFLLPKKNIDMSKWSVVACDQHSANPKYWQDLKEQIGSNPSTLNLILPECFLSSTDKALESIERYSNEYIKQEIFDTYNGYVFVRRRLKNGKVRSGLVFCIDLEQYSFEKNNNAFIRASEGTVLDRLPPRIKVRQSCALELPHVMLLADDKEGKLFDIDTNPLKKLYDFPLNMDGGSISGYLIEDCERINKRAEELLSTSFSRYGSTMLFIVGDGNHSLASAKRCYEQNKNETLRYALVEVVNIYDEGIDFEPIHRLVFNTDVKKLLNILKENGRNFSKKYSVYLEGEEFSVCLPNDSIDAVAFVENVVTEFLKENGGTVDYIHGDEELKRLSQEEKGLGIRLNAMQKETLFKYVVEHGALPKKTFSMGHAYDKRYYTEARQIKML